MNTRGFACVLGEPDEALCKACAARKTRVTSPSPILRHTVIIACSQAAISGWEGVQGRGRPENQKIPVVNAALDLPACKRASKRVYRRVKARASRRTRAWPIARETAFRSSLCPCAAHAHTAFSSHLLTILFTHSQRGSLAILATLRNCTCGLAVTPTTHATVASFDDLT